MHKVYLGIGGNIGNKKENQRKCFDLIGQLIGEIQDRSSVYETPPWGFESEFDFWNQAIKVDTHLSPKGILLKIKEIEGLFGRKRIPGIYSPREMDVDILLYDDLVIDAKELVVPHAHMHERKFVLVPMAEIAPGEVHPVFGKTMGELLEICPDQSVVKKL